MKLDRDLNINDEMISLKLIDPKSKVIDYK